MPSATPTHSAAPPGASMHATVSVTASGSTTSTTPTTSTTSTASTTVVDQRVARSAAANQHRPLRHHRPARIVVRTLAGPAIGPDVALAPGRHVIGRARSHVAVRLDDPTVEPHHLLLDVDGTGGVTVTQLCGRVPVRVDGAPMDGPMPVRDGTQLVLGATRLELRLGVETTGRPNVVPLGPFLRRPRTVVTASTVPVALPDPPDHGSDPPSSALPLLGAAVGGGGALVLAIVLRQPMFAVFGLLGLTVPLVTWIGGRVQSWRRRQRAERTYEETLALALADATRRHADRRTTLCRTAPTVAGALAAVDGPRQWERRPAHGDAFAVTLGWGDVTVDPPVCAAPPSALAQFSDAPVRLDLDRPNGHGELLAIVGPHDRAAAVLRGLVAQLAVFTGPADWRLVALGADADLRRWTRRLPHAHDPTLDDGVAVADAADPIAVTRLLDAFDMTERAGHQVHGSPVTGAGTVDHRTTGDRRRLVVLTDRAELLTTRTGPLRRLLDRRTDTVILLTVEHELDVPAVVTSVLQLGAAGRATWTDHGDRGIASTPAPGAEPEHEDRDDRERLVSWGRRLHVAGLPLETMEHLARRLAAHRDPEDPTTVTHPIPDQVRLGDLVTLPQTGADLLARWEADDTGGLPVVIGADGLGPVTLDLVADGPHALVAGTTGSGKSELLRSLVLGLALAHPPERCTFALVDFKGGAAFDACARLPHTVGLLTDLDGQEVTRVVAGLEAELRRRERVLSEAGATDLAQLRSVARLVVVVDEFAALAADHPDALRAFLSIAQRGRSLGVHLVLATQRPAGVVDDAIRANTDLRVALRLSDRADSTDVLGDPVAAAIPRRVPGRAAVRSVGADAGAGGLGAAVRLVQVAAVDGGEDGLRRLVELAIAAHHVRESAAPHRPWLPPLPDRLDRAELDAIASPDGHTVSATNGSDLVGIVDEPDHQRRTPLRWDTTRGNLALIGGRGTGTTTALISLVAARRPGTQLYVLDARGDADLERLDLLPSCGGVIRAHETERLDRCLRLLAGRITRPAMVPVDALVDDPDADVDDRVDGSRPEILLVIDGLGELRRSLDDPERAEALAHLDRILADGPGAGIRTVAALDPATANGAVLTRFAERWVFHLDDRADGPGFGVPARSVPPRRPGRLVVAATGLTAQLAVLVPTAAAADLDRRPRRVEVLPTRLPMAELSFQGASGPRRGPDPALALGLRHEDLSVAALDVDPGTHLTVVGPAGSGRTGLLRLLVATWVRRHGDDAVVALTDGLVATATATAEGDVAREPIAGTAPPVRHVPTSPPNRSAVDIADRVATELSRLADRHAPTLVVLDDADRLDDPLGRIAAALELLPPWVHLAVAIRSDVTHVRHGHWTAVVRRSGRGFVAATGNPNDGDLLGVLLPRRVGLPWRPGLWWTIGRSGVDLIQAAIPEPWPSRSTTTAGMMGA